MPSSEPSVSSEPALREAAEHEHTHEESEASGVLKVQ